MKPNKRIVEYILKPKHIPLEQFWPRGRKVINRQTALSDTTFRRRVLTRAQKVVAVYLDLFHINSSSLYLNGKLDRKLSNVASI